MFIAPDLLTTVGTPLGVRFESLLFRHENERDQKTGAMTRPFLPRELSPHNRFAFFVYDRNGDRLALSVRLFKKPII